MSILQACELELRTKFDDPCSHLALLSFISVLTSAIAEGCAGFILDIADLYQTSGALESLPSHHTQNGSVSPVGLTGHPTAEMFLLGILLETMYILDGHLYPGLSLPTGFPKMGRNSSISTLCNFLFKN